jgi:hypothetical protein
LTPLPYPSLFSTLVAFLAPLYFAHGQPVLEQACREISAWCVGSRARSQARHRLSDRAAVLRIPLPSDRPDPTPGSTLELPFLGETFTVQIPERHQASQLLRPPTNGTQLADLPALGQQPLHAASAPTSPRPGSTSSSGFASPLQNSHGHQQEAPEPKPQAQSSFGQRLGPPLASSGMARSASASSRATPPAALRAQAAVAPPSPRNVRSNACLDQSPSRLTSVCLLSAARSWHPYLWPLLSRSSRPLSFRASGSSGSALYSQSPCSSSRPTPRLVPRSSGGSVTFFDRCVCTISRC